MTRIEQIKKRLSEANKGPWQTREDYDYYEGGTYIGIGPEKYVPDEDSKYGGNKRVPCEIDEVQYFHQDICRVESPRDHEFIQHSREDVEWLTWKLEKAIEFLKAGKQQFTPGTTNSDVDVFLDEFKTHQAQGGGE